MLDFLTSEQKKLYQSFNEFAENNVMQHASEWDRDEYMPKDIINECIQRGYLGATIPKEYGGMAWDNIVYGLLNEAIGRYSVSLTGLFNVHTMVCQVLLKWGTEEQNERLLPLMAKGELLGAFALTEPCAGSDIDSIESEYSCQGDKLFLNGTKRWITFGGIADVVLVLGKLDGKPMACIVERGTPGFEVKPVTNMLGFRAAHLAVLEFRDCEINKNNIIGKEGFAFSYVVPYALEFGRISVAWAALGILRGCLEECSKYALKRKTFGRDLINNGQISSFITDMGVDIEAAKYLCFNASKLKNEHNPDATEKVMIAKYFSSNAAARHSANAVQIMGALGCNDSFLPSRYYRDSKTMEIIEGSNQIHHMLLGKKFARKVK